MIKLSIITVCYNDLNALKKTIGSVAGQTYMADGKSGFTIEHLIIDGNSSDGTKEYLKHVNNYPYLNFVSEPDKGIYDAMNKGINLAKGEWIQFLNAGDIYADDSALKSLIMHLDDKTDVIYGNAIKYDSYHQENVIPHEINEIKKGMILCHQAVFFRREMHKKYMYDIKFQLVSDYNSILKMYLARARFKHIDIFVVRYDMTGISASNLIITYKEICKVKKENGVAKKGIFALMLYGYGLIKRWVLMNAPQDFRWRLVGIKRKIVKKESLY